LLDGEDIYLPDVDPPIIRRRFGWIAQKPNPFLAAEIPHVAARDGTMPRFFGGENASGAPATSLWITNVLVQLFLIVTYFANSTYLALFSIASVAILVPYAFSGAYAAKLAITGEAYGAGENRTRDLAAGLVATVYGIWLVYAAGPALLFMAAMLYIAVIQRILNVSISQSQLCQAIGTHSSC
jgi:amino acid transporter